jgi:hypothetical protein
LSNRKKRLPAAGLTLMDLVVPLSVIVSSGAVQLVAFRSVFASNVKPGEGEGHEMISNELDHVILNEGAAASP